MQQQILACLLDVARGLEYLHNTGLLHGDLKAANVCLVNVAANSASQAYSVASPAAAVGPEGSQPAGVSPSSSRRGSSSSTTSSGGVDFVCKVRAGVVSRCRLDAVWCITQMRC